LSARQDSLHPLVDSTGRRLEPAPVQLVTRHTCRVTPRPGLGAGHQWLGSARRRPVLARRRSVSASHRLGQARPGAGGAHLLSGCVSRRLDRPRHRSGPSLPTTWLPSPSARPRSTSIWPRSTPTWPCPTSVWPRSPSSWPGAPIDSGRRDADWASRSARRNGRYTCRTSGSTD